MDWSTILGGGVLVAVGGILTAFLVHFREWPKARAEARVLRAEAASDEWARFQKEIGRLEERLSRVEKENETLRDRLDKQRGRERALEHENNQLRAQVEALENRLATIENLFRTHPLTDEMKEALEKLEMGE